MKVITRNPGHDGVKSHDWVLLEHEGRKLKITYEAGNAYERCNTDLFDGDKWNHLLSLEDIGFNVDYKIYVSDPPIRKKRADTLFEAHKKEIFNILK